LSFSSGELGWPVPEAVAETDAFQRGDGSASPVPLADPAIDESGGHVVDDGGAFEEVELLEHEPDSGSA
jgi:hypothetical protein